MYVKSGIVRLRIIVNKILKINSEQYDRQLLSVEAFSERDKPQ